MWKARTSRRGFGTAPEPSIVANHDRTRQRDPLLHLEDLAAALIDELVVALHHLLHTRIGHQLRGRTEKLLQVVDLLLGDDRPVAFAAEIGEDALGPLETELL